MQVPYRICTEIQATGHIRRYPKGYRSNTAEIMRAEECRNNRGRVMPRSRTYAGKHTAKYKRVTVCGIFEGEEQLNDIRQAPVEFGFANEQG